jgi:hypothetical protein
MSHRHWCDFAGHYWECDGSAIRLFAAEPTACMCLDHQTSMEDGIDHRECSVELLACPEHRDEQMRAMGYEPGYFIEDSATGQNDGPMFHDDDGNPGIGMCLWCAKVFLNLDEMTAHNANDMAACDVFQQSKDEHCMPPVLQLLMEEAGIPEEEDQP